MKSAANLIIQSAIGHPIERERRHVESAFIAGTVLIPEQEVDGHCRRKLRRPSKASVSGIERRGKNTCCSVQGGDVRAFACILESLLLQLLADLLRVVNDVVALRSVNLRHRFQNAAKTGTAVRVVRRKVGAAEKWLTIRQKEY